MQNFAAQQPYVPYPMYHQPVFNPPSNSDPEAKLHIADLHESVTEEVLWTQFKKFGNITFIKVLRDKATQKSKGYAKLAFQKAEDAKNARREMNLTFLSVGKRRIHVSKDKGIDQLKALQKHNMFVKGIPHIQEDPKTFYSYFSRYGEIQSIHICYEKQDGKETNIPAGHGFVLFENEKDNENLLKLKNAVYDEKYQLEIELYQPQGNKKKANNFYVREFTDKVLTQAEFDNEETKKKIIEDFLDQLKTGFSNPAYGEILSVICEIDATVKKPFGFVSFKDEEAPEKIMHDFNTGALKQKFPKNPEFIINLCSKRTSNKTHLLEDNALHIKNLKCFADKDEAKQFEDRCRKLFEKYGQVKNLKISEGQKPKQELENSNFAIVVFDSVKSATNFLQNYLSDPEIKTLFIKDNPHGNATICMPAGERRRMKRAAHQYSQNQKTVQQQQMFNQEQYARQNQMNMQMQQPNYMLGRGQPGMQMGGGRQRSLPQHRQQGQQQNRGGQGFNQRSFSNQNQQRTQNNRPYQQPQPGQPPKKIDQPSAQQAGIETKNPNGPLSLEDLKANLDQFTKLDPSKQSQILGNLIFPKVKEIVLAKGSPENMAPKITGMLIDFSVFEVTDILDILESKEELTERVSEAIELIKQQQQ